MIKRHYPFITIPPQSISHENGFAWIAEIPSLPDGDSPQAGDVSEYVLLEDGVPAKLGHCKHEDIRVLGLGRYSHWCQQIYFASSDNSDPRRNGRTYELAHQSDCSAPPSSPWRQPDETVPCLFIVGCGRSGTTVLFDLLKTNAAFSPSFGYPDGEDHDGWVKYGGATISGLGNIAHNHGHSGTGYCLGMDETDVAASLALSMNAYYFNEVQGGRSGTIVLNKNPHLSNKLRYVRAIFPQSRFVHIIREPVHMAASWVKMMEKQNGTVAYWPGGSDGCFWFLPAPDRDKHEKRLAQQDSFVPGTNRAACLAAFWNAINGNMARQLEDAPDTLLVVRYEDLCADPMATLERIFQFAGIPPCSHIPAWVSLDQRPLHPDTLSPEEIAEIRLHTEKLRLVFGYD